MLQGKERKQNVILTLEILRSHLWQAHSLRLTRLTPNQCCRRHLTWLQIKQGGQLSLYVIAAGCMRTNWKGIAVSMLAESEEQSHFRDVKLVDIGNHFRFSSPTSGLHAWLANIFPRALCQLHRKADTRVPPDTKSILHKKEIQLKPDCYTPAYNI